MPVCVAHLVPLGRMPRRLLWAVSAGPFVTWEATSPISIYQSSCPCWAGLGGDFGEKYEIYEDRSHSDEEKTVVACPLRDSPIGHVQLSCPVTCGDAGLLLRPARPAQLGPVTAVGSGACFLTLTPHLSKPYYMLGVCSASCMVFPH